MGFFDKSSNIKKLVKKSEYEELTKRHLQGEIVVPEIIILLEDKDEKVRELAAVALGEIAYKDATSVTGAIPGLIGLLRDNRWPGSPYVRGVIASILGRIGAVEALEELRGLLNDNEVLILDEKYTTVREVAKESIKRIEKNR